MGSTPTTIDPEYDIVSSWVAPALVKVEKDVSGFDVDVARVSPRRGEALSQERSSRKMTTLTES